MPTVTLIASSYIGAWAGGAWGTTTVGLLATADGNTNRIAVAAPDKGAQYDMATNRPAAASAVSAGELGFQSWRSSSYPGNCTFTLRNGAGSSLVSKEDGGPTSWTSGTQAFACAAADVPTLQIWCQNSNDNPTDVRVSYIDYDLTYTPASAGGFVWLMAGWLLFGVAIPGVLGMVGGGLGLEHMPQVRAELARQSHGTRRLLPNEDAAAFSAIKGHTFPAYSFNRRA